MHSLYYGQNHNMNNTGEEGTSERKQENIRTPVILMTIKKPFQFNELNLTTHWIKSHA